MELQRLLDLEALRKVRSLYSHYFDSNDLDGLMSLFTDDAVLEQGPDHGGDWIGREQIRRNYAEYIKGYGQPFAHVHAITNQWIELTGPDTAEARWYLLTYSFPATDAERFVLFGIYDDAYRKVDGKWKIHRSRLDFIWPHRHAVNGVPGHRPKWPGDL